MPLPTKLRSWYTTERGLVTVPDDTTTYRGTPAEMQQRAALATPSRSTAFAPPPFALADVTQAAVRRDQDNAMSGETP